MKIEVIGMTAVATLVALSLASSKVFANGLQEDRSYQFESAYSKQYKLNAELSRIKLKEGGFKQVFNVTADGASTVYVGNNTSIGEIGQQNNITNVANQSNVDIEGDGNTVDVGQNNENSSQGGSVAYADIGDNASGSPIGLQVGVPLELSTQCVGSCNP